MEKDCRKKVASSSVEIMPELDDPDGMKRAGEKKMPKVPKQKVKEACNESKGGVDCPIHGTKECP